jgi:hypothetical protein
MLARWICAGSLAMAACTVGASRDEATRDLCMNGEDDDEDGAVDCADRSCEDFCAEVEIDSGYFPIRDAGPLPDAVNVDCNAPLDVVFVLDVSTSMDDEAAKLRDGIASVWNAASALTTDTQFSLVVFVDDALAVDDCAPQPTLDALRGEFDEWREFCEGNLSPVSEEQNRDCPENSLDAIHLAAERCPWREDATRVLVHVTDDTFVERPDVLSATPFVFDGIPVQHTYAEVAGALVEREVRIGAFAAPGAGEDCGAGSSADVGRGFHDDYRGQPSLPMQTGGRVWSIRDVRAGTLEMSVAINDWIAAEYCTLF